MNDMATTRMLLTTAVLAAVAALIAGPAQAFVMDVEGGGGSGAAAAAPTPQTIPYLSHGIGVDETLFAGQQQSVNLNGDSVLTRVDNKAASTGDELDPAIRTAIAAREARVASLGRIRQNGPIPYLSHGMGVDESQFSGLQSPGLTGDAVLTRVRDAQPVASGQSGSSGTERDWTWIGLGAGLFAALAAAMAAFYLSNRQRGRVALP
jgi:hypothetical protein